jgi:hypothetical protein
MEPTREAPIPPARVATIAIDFLTHGVALAGYWRATAEYWRPPQELFRLIPLSYGAFAVLCTVLTWLLARLYGREAGIGIGLRFGAVAGLLYSGVGAVGTYCVFRMPASALVVWTAAGTVLAAAACAAAGWTMGGPRPWRRAGAVLLLAIALLVAGVVVQNLLGSYSAGRS